MDETFPGEILNVNVLLIFKLLFLIFTVSGIEIDEPYSDTTGNSAAPKVRFSVITYSLTVDIKKSKSCLLGFYFIRTSSRWYSAVTDPDIYSGRLTFGDHEGCGITGEIYVDIKMEKREFWGNGKFDSFPPG